MVRVLGAAAVAAVVISTMAACTEEDSSTDTLPPIITTTSTTTTMAPTTTLPRFYEVQSGDTLTAIAAVYGLPIEAIMRVNGITDQNNIQVGQVLELPSAAIIANSPPDGPTTITTAP